MSDLLKEEAIRQAEELARQGWDVHFKFTCFVCGTRCILRDANVLYEYGECFRCGARTKLDRVGYLLVRTL